MGTRRQEDRQVKRALEQLDKMVGRQDAEGAVTALLGLPQGQRSSAHVSAVAALFGREVNSAHDRGAWNRLAQCAGWAEREPGLVDDAWALWPLFWGCARSSQWQRAERLWQQIRAPLDRRARGVVAIVDAWLAARGSADAAGLAGIELPALPGADRLGHDRPAARSREVAPSAAPRTVEEIESIAIEACATRPWRGFAELVSAWIRDASGSVRTGICVVAGQLAARELLQRVRAAQRSQREDGAAGAGRGVVAREVYEPAALLARIVQAATPPELAGESLLAFRLALSAIGEEGLRGEDLAVQLSEIARAALCYPAHRPLVGRALVHTAIHPEACKAMLGLFEELVVRAPDIAVCVKAARVWDRALDPDDDRAAPIPGWLCRGLDEATRHPAEGLAWLRDADLASRQELLEVVGARLPTEQAADLVDRLWQGADEPLRRALSEVVRNLIARSSRLGRSISAVPSRQELRKLVREVEHQLGPVPPEIRALLREAHEPEVRSGLYAMLGGLVDEPSMSQAAVDLWGRFEARVLPYSEQFLVLALGLAGRPAERRMLVDRYLAGRSDIDSRLEVLPLLKERRDRSIARAVQNRLLSEFRDDVEALARGLDLAVQGGAPKPLQRALAAALVDGHRNQPGPRTSLVHKMLPQASRLARLAATGRAKPAGPRKAGTARRKSGSERSARSDRTEADRRSAADATIDSRQKEIQF